LIREHIDGFNEVSRSLGRSRDGGNHRRRVGGGANLAMVVALSGRVVVERGHQHGHQDGYYSKSRRNKSKRFTGEHAHVVKLQRASRNGQARSVGLQSGWKGTSSCCIRNQRCWPIGATSSSCRAEPTSPLIGTARSSNRWMTGEWLHGSRQMGSLPETPWHRGLLAKACCDPSDRKVPTSPSSAGPSHVVAGPQQIPRGSLVVWDRNRLGFQVAATISPRPAVLQDTPLKDAG